MKVSNADNALGMTKAFGFDDLIDIVQELDPQVRAHLDVAKMKFRPVTWTPRLADLKRKNASAFLKDFMSFKTTLEEGDLLKIMWCGGTIKTGMYLCLGDQDINCLNVFYEGKIQSCDPYQLRMISVISCIEDVE
jgi:hypothetical protein